MFESSSAMGGSGFVAVGLLFAVILHKVFGMNEWHALNYGMIAGFCVLIALFVGILGYVLWKTFFGPDEPA
jgi:hypothetical protein